MGQTNMSAPNYSPDMTTSRVHYSALPFSSHLHHSSSYQMQSHCYCSATLSSQELISTQQPKNAFKPFKSKFGFSSNKQQCKPMGSAQCKPVIFSPLTAICHILGIEFSSEKTVQKSTSTPGQNSLNGRFRKTPRAPKLGVLEPSYQGNPPSLLLSCNLPKIVPTDLLNVLDFVHGYKFETSLGYKTQTS